MPKIPKGIFKRARRGYYCRVYTGGRERWVALGRTLSEAKSRFHVVKSSATTPTAATVGQLARQWQTTYVRTARGAYNQQQTESRVKRFLVEFLGLIKAARLSPEDLRRYRLWLEGKGLAPMTVKHVLSDARCLLNWAEDAGFIDRSPFPKRLMPRMQERPPDRLGADEVDAVTAVPNPHGFVVRLALGTGLRWGELTRANMSDIQEGVLLVHQTKSGKVRRVPLPPELRAELKTRIGKLVEFPNSDHFNRAVRLRSGVEHFHIHQCRHTFACRWLERGGSLAALQQILGHATIITTQRYARISDDFVKAEAGRIYTVATTVATAESVDRQQQIAE